MAIKIFPRARAAIKEVKEAVQSLKKGMKDGVLDEEEALSFIKESFEAGQVVLGKVTLSPNAKAIVRALCEELLRRLEEHAP